MVKSLTNLSSTNNNGTRTVFVDVAADGGGANTNLQFVICAANSTEPITLAANAQQQVAHAHQETGSCFVTCTDPQSGQTTQKFLNLDAPISS
jgi:hypothetical protein